jgi:hypothetical protein
MTQQRPDYTVFISSHLVNEGQEMQTYFSEVGAAWRLDNGCISINLVAIPTDGKLVLFPALEKVTPRITPTGSGFTFDG